MNKQEWIAIGIENGWIHEKYFYVWELEETCSGCPTRYNGRTDDGEEIEFYLRHGYVTISVNGYEILHEDVSHKGKDGVCSLDFFLQVAKENGILIKVV